MRTLKTLTPVSTATVGLVGRDRCPLHKTDTTTDASQTKVKSCCVNKG
jgi:hypothetical protein